MSKNCTKIAVEIYMQSKLIDVIQSLVTSLLYTSGPFYYGI